MQDKESAGIDGLPEVLSHYRIVKHVGSGGMGRVYLAEDLKLGRRVAIKVLPEDSGEDDSARRRLLREAQAAATLDHPHICSIFEVGEDGPRVFIVMQYVEGETLASRMYRSRLSLRESLQFAAQIADALAEAHAHGVIHRDIKPSNIMITGRGQAMLMDFGLAKVGTEQAAIDETRSAVTRGGMVLGTVPYTSPEQACGEPVDYRTDIFSLGAVIYEMVTGHQPFETDSLASTVAAILTRDPPPLSAFANTIPAGLERIVGRALSKDRTKRYQSASDMHLDLRQVELDLRDDATFPRAGPPTGVAGGRRHGFSLNRTRMMQLSGVALVLAAAIMYYAYSSPRLTERDTLLIAEFANTTDDRELGDALKQALAVHLGQSPFLNILSDESVIATLRLMNRSPDEPLTPMVAREICQRLGVKAYLSGSIRQVANQYVIGLDAVNADTGESIAREQGEAEGKQTILGVVGRSASRLRERLGESLQASQKFDVPIEKVTTSSLDALKAFSLGMKLGNRGRFAEARPLFERAVELDPNFAIAYAKLAINLASSGRLDVAPPYAARAYELRARTSEPERLEIIVRYHNYVTGNVHRLLDTVALWKATYPRERMAWNMSALSHYQLGQQARAVDDAREAIRLDPDFLAAQSNLGRALIASGHFAEARRVYEDALARKLELPLFHFALYEIGFVQGDAGLMNQQLEWTRSTRAESVALNWEAESASSRGQITRARELYMSAMGQAEKRQSTREAGRIAVVAALNQLAFGRCDEAMRYVSESRRHLVTPHEGEALVLALCGEPDRAEALVEKLRATRPEDTILNEVYLPVVRAAVEVTRGNDVAADQLLGSVARYAGAPHLSTYWVNRLRGSLYAREKKFREAMAEFDTIRRNRGWNPKSPLYPLAHLELARAAALAGDVATGRKAYEELLNFWKDADPDLPQLIAAKRELQQLGS